VPIYIRAGKSLPLTAAEIVVEFHDPPRAVFGEEAAKAGYVRMRLSPDVCAALGLRMKRPGEHMSGENVELTLSQRAASRTPPYQRLLGDAMRGDGELFGRQDIVDAQWRIVEPTDGELFGRQDIVDAQWRIVEPILADPPPIQEYARGTWGPAEAQALIGADGPWRDPKPEPGA
jgi:glucose-6-phosphate 1-dehydrogenase